MKETFRAEYVRCGEPGCRTCPHGPYWYAYHKEGGRTKKRYVGKRHLDMPTGDDVLDAIFNRATATVKLARAILGVEEEKGARESKAAFRKLCMEHHPDREGDSKAFSRINAAWSYLQSFYGW